MRRSFCNEDYQPAPIDRSERYEDSLRVVSAKTEHDIVEIDDDEQYVAIQEGELVFQQ